MRDARGHADFADGGSDRLVDALVATDEEQAADRVAAHFAAGADQVCLQALAPKPGDIPLDQWRRLAPIAAPAAAPTAARPPSRNVVA